MDRKGAATNSERGRSRSRFHLPGMNPLWSWVVIAIAALVVVFGLIVFIDAGLYHNKVHSGITVGGQDMGGRTRDEAVAELSEYVDDLQRQPLTLVSGDRTWAVLPDDVGTNIEIANAVDIALAVTRQHSFFTDLKQKFSLYRDQIDIPLKGTIDATKMDTVLSGVARDLHVEAVDAVMVITGGQIEVLEARQGRAVDLNVLRQQVKDLVLSLKSAEVEVPLTVVEPKIVAADLQPARDRARAMVGSPVTLTSGEQSWTLTPQDLITYVELTYEEVNGTSTPVLDVSAAKMTDFFTGVAEAVAVAPVDASFDYDGTKAWVVPGVPGKVLDPAKTAEAITAAARKTAGRTAQVALMDTEPDLTTEEAEAMGIKDLLAKYTTEPYWGSANRRQNVRVATKYCSNIFMAPGDEFNTDKQLGPRTPARGYTTAPGIVSLGELEDVLGGGICQVSTTLFNAVFFAGLEVVERHNHSIYISHYPKGRDATVTAGGKNMRFRNDTDHYIWIMGESDGVTTTFYIYGTDDGRSVDYTTSDFYNFTSAGEKVILDPTVPMGTTFVEDGGSTGKTCLTTRIITYGDGNTKTEKYYSVFPAVPKTIVKGTGATTTTKPTTTTTTEPPTTEPPTSSTTTTTTAAP